METIKSDIQLLIPEVGETLAALAANSRASKAARHGARVAAVVAALYDSGEGGAAAVVAAFSASPAQTWSTRPAFLAGLGTGRKQACDGAAWDAALERGVREYFADPASWTLAGVQEGLGDALNPNPDGSPDWVDAQFGDRAEMVRPEIAQFFLAEFVRQGGGFSGLLSRPVPPENSPENSPEGTEKLVL